MKIEDQPHSPKRTTKRDLVMRISEETGLIQQDVQTVVQKTLDYITESLARGENVEFRNFGVFEVCERKQRIGRNPNKPEQVVTIPTRKVVKFKPGKVMKLEVTGDVESKPVKPN
jgi:nucleoid DNA-binding protein